MTASNPDRRATVDGITVVDPADYRLVLTIDHAGLMSVRTPLPRDELLALLLSAATRVLTDPPVGGTP